MENILKENNILMHAKFKFVKIILVGVLLSIGLFLSVVVWDLPIRYEFICFISYLIIMEISALCYNKIELIKKGFWLLQSLCSTILCFLVFFERDVDSNLMPFCIVLILFGISFTILHLLELKYKYSRIRYFTISFFQLWVRMWSGAVFLLIFAIPILHPNGLLAWAEILSVWVLFLLHPVSLLYVIKQNLQELKQYD